jgi:post-segregation antitoxin (ccd killing protein)
LIHSSISERALARVIAESAARRWRSQEKLSSCTAHSSDGGVISNGDLRSQITTLPAKAKRPA